MLLVQLRIIFLTTLHRHGVDRPWSDGHGVLGRGDFEPDLV